MVGSTDVNRVKVVEGREEKWFITSFVQCKMGTIKKIRKERESKLK